MNEWIIIFTTFFDDIVYFSVCLMDCAIFLVFLSYTCFIVFGFICRTIDGNNKRRRSHLVVSHFY